MRRVLMAILSGALLLSLASPAGAQHDPCASITPSDGVPCVPVPITQGLAERFAASDPCTAYAAQAALPALAQSYTLNPTAGGPVPFPPFTQPFGPGPAGPPTLYSPPGLLPVYGPLGPGRTAMAIAQAQTAPPTLTANGTPIQNFGNAVSLLGLAGLQQAELGTLYGRYGVAASNETVAGGWVSAWATQAGATLAIARGLCRGQHEAASRGAPSASR